MRRANQAHDGGEVDERCSRQFMAMWENRRCSILFHLLVPGGKWHDMTWVVDVNIML